MPLRILLAALLHLCIPAGRADPPTPILTGTGKDAFSTRDMQSLGGLVHAVIPGATEEPWLLDGIAYQSGPHSGEVFRADVYLTPRVLNPRIIRCRSLTCVTLLVPNTWYPASPVVGGWSSADRRPHEVVMVAPPDQPFTVGGPYSKAFSVFPPLADDEVIAVVDAERVAAPEQQPTFVQPLNPARVRVMSLGTKGARNLMIDFQKADGVWTEIKRSRWMD